MSNIDLVLEDQTKLRFYFIFYCLTTTFKFNLSSTILNNILIFILISVILGSKILYGTDYMRWRQHLNQKLMENLTLKIL